MKDNLQNIADLIGALAEDIEEIKKKIDVKDSPDKDEALKRLAVKLEPVIRFVVIRFQICIFDILNTAQFV